MNLTEKNQILSFVNEIDSVNVSKYVFNSNFANIDGFESRVIQIYESLFKNVFLPHNFTIYLPKIDDYRTPDFHALLTFQDVEIYRVRNTILKLDSSDCDFLLQIAQETRNPLEHGTYKESDESLKEELTGILFKSLKNAYEYKTGKKLDITFADFLAALKFTKEQQLEESNKELRESNEEKDKIIAELNEKLSLSINKVEVVADKPKRKPTKTTKKKEPKIEKEIKYSEVLKNEKYIIPKELGQDVKVTHSSHIDIAFDFLDKGWFEEAKKEISGLAHPLSDYVLFLANNRLKNINDLIASNNYEFFLKELIKLLADLPLKSVREITEQIVAAFCEISSKEPNKKINIFSYLISLTTTNEILYKDNFFNFLLSSNIDFGVLRVGFELYFSSFKDSEYFDAVVKSFGLMLKQHKFKLMFDVKDAVLHEFNNPELIKILFMAQAGTDSFNLVPSGIDGIFNSNYLSLLLNYDFYNNKKEFDTLKEWIITSIENSSKLLGIHNETNAIVLLECITQYLTEKEFDKLTSLWIELFKSDKTWVAHTKECLLLIDLIKEKPIDVCELFKHWFESSNIEYFDFYKQSVEKAKSYGVEDEFISKADILLSLSLTNTFKSFNQMPDGITNSQIENYLKLSANYDFISALLEAITKKVDNGNVAIYSKAFELLLPYYKGDENRTFKIINSFASSLVKEGRFDVAEKFYRYMLGLNINSSICYWGLLFCECNTKNIDELSNVENLYDNELFQATLHSSKEESPNIYKQCLDVYSTHKINTEKRIKRRKDKRERRLSFVVVLTQLISMFALAIAGFVNASVMWPFFIVAGVIFISIPLYQTVLAYPPRRNIISGIAILCIEAISWAALGGVHIARAANASSNYEELRTMMMNVKFYSDAYTIKNKTKTIPTTYKDIGQIKDELKDLEWAFNRSYGRERFGKVNNFSVNHYNWDCSAYLYNYNFKSLFIGANWKVDNSTKTLSYYRDGSGERFSAPSSVLPNNMKSGQDYYFYAEYDYLNDENALVNQYMKIGYENKNDPTDKFLAYEFGYYHFDKDGKRRIEVYCYSDDSSHYLLYDSEY
jgi:hypothetical protein